MTRLARIAVWGGCVLMVLATGAWIYCDRLEQREHLALADQSIESGIVLFKEKQYVEALEVFEAIPQGVEREWYARYYQGSTYIMLKDYQSAIPYLDQALVLNPTETQVMHALGVAYFKMGKLKMAKAYYTSILEVNPQDMEARGLLEAMTNMEKRQLEAEQIDTPGQPTDEPGK